MVGSLIRSPGQTVIAGVVLQEVLQGIKNEKSFHLVGSLMGRLAILEPDQKTYLNAARIFRSVVNGGKSCTTVDALIAALAVQYGVRLFTLDRDFQTIAKHSDLKLFPFS